MLDGNLAGAAVGSLDGTECAVCPGGREGAGRTRLRQRRELGREARPRQPGFDPDHAKAFSALAADRRASRIRAWPGSNAVR